MLPDFAIIKLTFLRVNRKNIKLKIFFLLEKNLFFQFPAQIKIGV